MKRSILAIFAVCFSSNAIAQDLQHAEILVTGTRIDQDDYSSEMPAVGLRRTADFLVQEVAIRGDTRDEDKRRAEIRSMLERAVRIAGEQGLELAYGDYILTPLTLANIEDVGISDDHRPDSERIDFLVKAPLGAKQSGTAAEAQIKKYVDAVPEVGRAQMDEIGDSTLSVVGPDSHRPKIAEEIAKDSQMLASKLGDGYGVEIEGLNMPVQWTRSGPSEVMLFIPYKLRIVPKP